MSQARQQSPLKHYSLHLPEGVRFLGESDPSTGKILTLEALKFVAELDRKFRDRRREIFEQRYVKQLHLDGGWRPGFLEETQAVREGDWKVAAVPADLLDRRIEITGPVDRKMIINALNSDAKVFMADFEDSSSPAWGNMIEGQVNLYDAVRGTITFENEQGKTYELGEDTATLMVRPRGWHMSEKHVIVDDYQVSAALFDFGLFLFHNAQELIDRGSGPYFYLPKLESHLEARLWNDVFVFAQEQLGIPVGTIKATVLIETIMAAFEMDEILYELRDHSAGLNCGRWDYIFSFIKRFQNHPGFVLPDRDQVGMDQHFLSSYSQLLVKTCHKRGAHAMGGMAAQIPVKDDPVRNWAALDKVRADKKREAQAGHDGTWVAHPGLIEVAREEFDAVLGERPNQIERQRDDVNVSAEDLLSVPHGTITEAGLRKNLNVGILYLEAWLRGKGCVPIYGLMEDAATAEISRVQVWQWKQHGAQLDDGRTIDKTLVRTCLYEELEAIKEQVGETAFSRGYFKTAADLFDRMLAEWSPSEFLTILAYDHLRPSLVHKGA